MNTTIIKTLGFVESNLDNMDKDTSEHHCGNFSMNQVARKLMIEIFWLLIILKSLV